MKDKWYVATLITRCRIEDEKAVPWTCDEQVRIIQAPNEDTAYDKAINIGKEEEHSYKNSDGKSVYWEFLGLENLEELLAQSIQDGTEIRSRIFFREDPSELVCPKDELTVYRAQRNRHLTANEIITQLEEGE